MKDSTKDKFLIGGLVLTIIGVCFAGLGIFQIFNIVADNVAFCEKNEKNDGPTLLREKGFNIMADEGRGILGGEEFLVEKDKKMYKAIVRDIYSENEKKLVLTITSVESI